MTGVLSAFSGLFNKAFFFGTFVPVALFVALNIILLVRRFPGASQLLAQIEAYESRWELIAVPSLTLLMSALLYNLNSVIIQFYQGASWKDSLIGVLLTKLQRYRYEETKYWFDTLQKSHQKASSVDSNRREMDRLQTILHSEFPREVDLILPTRLGNVMQNSESYPFSQYRMLAPVLRPRLFAILPKEYAQSLEDTKASFDFMLNCSVLSFVLALEVLFVGLILRRSAVVGIVESLLLFLLAIATYRGAVSTSAAWGDVVKGAFDLYRRTLLSNLGFEREPATWSQECQLWQEISDQLALLSANDLTFKEPPRADSSPPPFYAEGISEKVRLETARGIQISSEGGLTVCVRVMNVDRTKSYVAVVDTVPEGFGYEWGSAELVDGSHRPKVTGSNPYCFHIGGLAPGQAKTLTYGLIPYKK